MSTDAKMADAGWGPLVTANSTVAGMTTEEIASQHPGLTQPTSIAEEQGNSQVSTISVPTSSQETSSTASRRRSIHNPAAVASGSSSASMMDRGKKNSANISLAGIRMSLRVATSPSVCTK